MPPPSPELLAGRTLANLAVVSREELLRRGLFGTKVPTRLDEPVAAANVWLPTQLAALANALIGEYGGQYGGRAWNGNISGRFGATEVSGHPVPRALAVESGRIDLSVVDALPADESVPFLRQLLRVIHREAQVAHGEGPAHRGYRAAVTRLWGNHERVLGAAQRILDDNARVHARLVVKRGVEPRTWILLERAYLLGRDPASDVLIAQPTVSRRHARLVALEGAHAVTDLSSASGTLLNGVRLEGERALRRGDLLQLGDVQLVYDLA